MMQAVFLDFYGTVVHEDGEIVQRISQEIADTGWAASASEVGAYWWAAFQTAFLSACGDNYVSQRELEIRSLADTIRHFGSSANVDKLSRAMFAHWQKPPLFPDAREFFALCPLPIYIVSNIDRADIQEAIRFHALGPSGVFTSEDARAYKPDRALFEYALAAVGLAPGDVLHIGDSLTSDVQGAADCGIPALWLNRGGRAVPGGVDAADDLLAVLGMLKSLL